MSLLDDLKEQAKRIKDEAAALEERKQRQRVDALDKITPALVEIHRYLKELAEQLNVIKPQIRVNFPVREVGELTDLEQGNYREVREGDREQTSSVTFAFTLEGRRHYRFDVSVPGNVDQWLNNLKNEGLKIDHAQVLDESSLGHRVWINVSGFVPVKLRFAADLEKEGIVLTVRNYDSIGEMRHRITPEQVDEQFLDELGRYILRRPNRFLRMEVPAEVRDRLRKKIELDQKRKEEELYGPMGALSSRIRSLFKRRHVLALRYDARQIHVDESSDIFVMGRGDNCDLVINAKHVSRRHARIEFRSGEFVLVDESRNGTYVNTPMQEGVHLRREEIVLTGSGVISLGAPIEADTAHLIHYSI